MSQDMTDSLPLQQFRTASPKATATFLDTGRAEVMLNMIVAPDLDTDDKLCEFVGAAYGASGGNSVVLRMLIDAFSHWPQLDSEAVTLEIKRLWKLFEERAPDFDCIATLRRICTEQSFPLPTSLVEAIFDDPSFDFVAYLSWHNS